MTAKMTAKKSLDDLDEETQLNFASRLSALEYFACHLLATIPAAFQIPGDIDRMHRRMLDELSATHASSRTEPNPEMVMSEMQYAIRRLISLQRELLGMPRRPRD